MSRLADAPRLSTITIDQNDNFQRGLRDKLLAYDNWLNVLLVELRYFTQLEAANIDVNTVGGDFEIPAV
ncbi:unnamed protein product [marine sediment metagenome]|uniref:Uncharacterized protein n=1 Tax=marine sediment metagenome TaxID=412755 RepID=X1M4A9_9ZZZZ